MLIIKVKGNIKLKIEKDITFGYSSLKMEVAFRKQNSILKETLSQRLVMQATYSRIGDTVRSFDLFLEECELWLDESRLKVVAREMIQDYFKKEAKRQYSNNKQSNILNQIKKINKEKVEVEVEIE